MPTKLIFRVWSYYHRKYLPLEFKGSELCINANGLIGYTNPKKDNPCLPQDELRIELWIRLKDKKGVKIYEGDIVKAKKRIIDPNYPEETEEAEPFIAIVKKYHDDSIPLYFMMYKTTNNNDVFDFEYYEVEVIGNIHENPELLESLEN